MRAKLELISNFCIPQEQDPPAQRRAPRYAMLIPCISLNPLQ